MARALAGRVAIVTGAGRGIGRAEALALASEGTSVVVNDLDLERAGDTNDLVAGVVEDIRTAGGEAIAGYGSVASYEDGERIVRLALERFGRLDILVNNAGIVRPRMIFNMTEADWDDVCDVNLKGHFIMTRFAAQVFRQQRSGRIVNTSSEASIVPLGQGNANYSASKEGIAGFTRTVALELGRYGVTCNAVRPRASTRLTQSGDLQAVAKRTKAAAPDTWDVALRIAEQPAAFGPEQVAQLVVYLCSDLAVGINGRDFIVGGDEISLVSPPAPICSLFARGGWTLAQLEHSFPRAFGATLSRAVAAGA